MAWDPKATTGRFKSWFLVCQVGNLSCVARGFRETDGDPTLEKIVSGRPPTSSGTTRRPADILSHTMTTIWRPHWLIKHVIPVKEEVPDDDVPDVKVEPPADDDGINAEDEKTHLEGKGAKRKRGPPTKGPCEHGVKYARSARCAALVRTVVGALSARSAVGQEYASTVVSALGARSAVVHQSASTVVCALSARSAVGHQSASTVVSALSARSAVGHKYASTVVSLSVQGVRWGINLRARSSSALVQGVRWGINLRARSSAL